MRFASSIAVLPVLAALAGCAGVAERAGLPAGWEDLRNAPASFAALYRLDCCGRRNLLVTLRCDGASLDLTVTAPPGASLLRAFFAPEGGWLFDVEARCVAAVPPAGLPLGGGHVLPLRPGMAAVLMSGGVPPNSVPVSATSTWVAATSGGGVWSSRIGGPSPHVTEARLQNAAGEMLLEARLDEHRLGRIPGTLDLRAGGERFSLTLMSWRGSAPVEPPAWVASARCGERE